MSVRVVARIRPLLNSELDKDTIVTADGAVVRIPSPKNESESHNFQFNAVYCSETTQQGFFDGEVAPTVRHLFNGFDVTLFAYGVTGTGKTHTMRGGKLLADRGVIPRMLSGIYRRARKVEKDSQGATHVEVTMSYYEIYNDKVFDLFESPEKRTLSGLPLREAGGGKTVVAGLTERPCESLKEFEKLYDQANVNRSTGATKLNAHSSRSHAILHVNVSLITGEETRTSTASAIDLAGSEDNRRTENSKERLVESSSINKSLFVLAQCVEAISKKATRIPYRESKMTRILSLGQNNGLTIMILNLAPVRSYHLDTMSSLNFANRTKKIEVREIENEPIFKGCARPVATAPSFQRQPLRAITSAVHNANVRKSAGAVTKANGKPAKAFSVYADSAQKKRSNAPKRSSPSKRSSDTFRDPARPAKKARPSPATFGRPQPAISKATIEDLVEKKVSEILAARALDQPVPAHTVEISDEVKRRLELLEQKIEGQDDDRTEGLNFLLMAKQHNARGEDSSALKMYELAQDYFPDNAKLDHKITKLRQKLQDRKDAEQQAHHQKPISLAKMPIQSQASRKSREDPEDGDYQEPGYYDHGDGDLSDEVFAYKTKPKSKTRVKVTPLTAVDSNAPQTPRTRQLLSIVNSRDIGQIRLLKGVGAKKAEAIVEALSADTADGGRGGVDSLGQLGILRGIGAKAVENMRMGLVAGDEHDF